MAKISVVLATYNEEKNIGPCLESVRDLADEIVVVDGTSVDKTREIAKKYKAVVIKTTNKPIFHINKQMAIDKASGDWILQLDADERVTPELRDEILKTISFPGPAYYIKRKNYFLGKWMKGGGMWPDPVIRFFKKGKAYLPQKSVHEQMVVKGKVGTLKNPIEHYTAPTFFRYLTNANRYTTLTAIEYLNQDPGINPLQVFMYIFWKPLSRFLSLFLRYKGFRDGFQGFIFSLFSGLHFPIAYIKYWEAKRTGQTNLAKDWV